MKQKMIESREAKQASDFKAVVIVMATVCAVCLSWLHEIALPGWFNFGSCVRDEGVTVRTHH